MHQAIGKQCKENECKKIQTKKYFERESFWWHVQLFCLYWPLKSTSRIFKMSRNIRKESLTGLTRSVWLCCQKIGTSFIAKPNLCARNNASTSNAPVKASLRSGW